MFEKVLAGDRRRREIRNRQALAASVLAHVMVAAGAAYVPLGVQTRAAAVEEVVSFVDLAAPLRPRQAAALPRIAPNRTGAAATRVQRSAPAEAPPATGDAPPAAPMATPLRTPAVRFDLAFPLPGSSGPIAALARPAVGPAPEADQPVQPGELVEADVLAERPRLANRMQMERVWKRLYPPALEMRGVTGEAVVSFVIDESGRVVPESIQLISATRPEFGDAVLDGVPLLRFRPMKLGGVAVRVRTTLPVLWTLPS